MRVVLTVRVLDDGPERGFGIELHDPTPERLKREVSLIQFQALNMIEGGKRIINGNAAAAGMNRLLDGENVKNTVK